MLRVDRRINPLRWVRTHVPKSQIQLEQELKGALKIIFWLLLILPVVLFPLYYLLVALGG
jgi:hypothetical protein